MQFLIQILFLVSVALGIYVATTAPQPPPPKKQRSKLDDMTPFTGICFIIGKVSSLIHNLQVDIFFEATYTTKYTLWAHVFIEITLITASMLAEQFPASIFTLVQTTSSTHYFSALHPPQPLAALLSRLREYSAGCSWS